MLVCNSEMADDFPQAGDTDIILSYFDTLIRRVDMRSLEDGRWLTDAVIGFYFEYLQKAKFDRLQDAVAFVPPETTQWMKMTQTPQDVVDTCDALKLHEKLLVFFPINDEIDVTKAGGTHWSLLLLSRISADSASDGAGNFKFYHFDSCQSHRNKCAAMTLAQHVVYALDAAKSRDRMGRGDPQANSVEKHNSMPSKSSATSSETTYTSFGRLSRNSNLVTEVPDTPQQTNSSDCGVCVLLFAETLAESLKTSVEDAMPLSSDAKSDSVSGGNAKLATAPGQSRSTDGRTERENPDAIILSALKPHAKFGLLADAVQCSQKRNQIKVLISELNKVFL